MRRTPPSRLRRAWLALGIVLVGVLAWRLWPTPEPGPPSVTLALPDAPETTAPPPRPDERPPVVEIADGPEAPTLPVVSRAAASDTPGASDAPAGGVRITLPGARGSADPAPSRAARPAAVPPAPPDPALTKKSEAGMRPAIGPDGRTPFSAYRRLQPLGEAPAVAVLLGGLGFDPALTARAVALPPEISLSFVPYAKDVAAQMEAARAAGHEVLIELPMSQAGASPETLGPAALDPKRGAAGNRKRLDWLLARSPAYPMVTNYLGRGVAEDGALAAQVMNALSGAGVAFLDDTGRLSGAARAAGVPYAAVDVLAGPGEAATALNAAAAGTGAGEVRLVKLYASGETLAALEAFARGATLAPASSKVAAP